MALSRNVKVFFNSSGSDSPQQPEIKKKAKPEANKERDERNHKSRKEDKRSQKHKEKVQKA
jgi:hypothetical protein